MSSSVNLIIGISMSLKFFLPIVIFSYFCSMKKIILICISVMMLTPSQAQFWRKKSTAQEDTNKLEGLERFVQVFGLINDNYVTTPDMEKLSAEAINAMLKVLDPHSVYIPAKDVQRANEGLQGNFEGVGISFQIVHDTIVVADVISGGPSEKVGVMMGDKIIRIDGGSAVGDSVNTTFVSSHLRGKKGTTVVVDVLRQGQEISFHIVRDKIPIFSIDSYFMANDTIGYIRLVRFSRTSVNEFRKALGELKKKGMTALILDLRGNGGGYLDIACGMANEFLKSNSLLVYTEGRTVQRQNFRANRYGEFREGRLVVLIDENSASASEIVSGAVQDWDRGTIIGRRSFGKGLVQRMYELKDGGQIRLTTARYFTPSGRCIQKSYDKGVDAYHSDIAKRYQNGELVNPDSVHFPDSLKYKTQGGRTVYGGGGIMPDIFVPMDTMRLSDYFINIRAKGLLNDFPMQWANQNRKNPLVSDFDSYLRNYDQLGLDTLFAAYATQKEVVRDTAAEAAKPEQTQHSDNYLHQVLKAQVARDLFGIEYYYLVMRDIDEGYLRAVRYIIENR